MDQSHDDDGREGQPAWWHSGHAGYAGHAGEPGRPDEPTQSFEPVPTAGIPPVASEWARGSGQPAGGSGTPPAAGSEWSRGSDQPAGPPWAPRHDQPAGGPGTGNPPWAAGAAGAPPVSPAWAPQGAGPTQAEGRPTWGAAIHPPHPPTPSAPPWSGYPGGYGPLTPPGGPVQPGTQGGRGRRRALRLAAAIAVVAATTAAGIGVGHDLWRPAGSTNALPPASSTTQPSGGNGSVGSGNTGSGGTLPGNGNGNGNGNGEFPGFFPSGGTGSSGGGSSSSASGSPANVSSIAAKVAPGLVDVVTTLGYQGGQAAGTGIVLTSNGEVLTNNHVIDGATNIQVTDIGNGHTYTATVVGYSRTSDVAIIQLQGASGLATASIGDSSKVADGDGVVAIGNAGGVGGTPSAAGGSVTGLDQTITASDENGSNSETLTGLIEINANIQPGDSGGSLVNTSGQVIGMDTAASSGFVSSTKDGYAIPINAAISIAQQIEAGQASTTVHVGRTGFLGVSVSSPQSGSAGAEVQSVVPGLPASSAGLTAGDVITAVDGQAVSSPDGLTTQLLQRHPGDTIQITYTAASGQQHTVSVTLANGPAQ